MEIKEYLEERGWIEFNNPVNYRQKIYCQTFHDLSEYDCENNDKAPQIVISYYSLRDFKSFSIELKAEYNHEWVNLEFYGLSENDLKNSLDKKVNLLYTMWNSLTKG